MAESIAISTAPVETAAKRYHPSWVDRLFDWIERRPFPPWAFYAGLSVVLIGVECAILFADGTYPDQISLWHFILPLTGVYFLALVHWLDRAAARILAAFRPAMTVDDVTYERLAYELTNLPAGPVLRFSAIWCASSLLLIVTTARSDFAALGMYTSTPATVYEIGLWIFIWWVGGALNYHTIHQLRLVSRILNTHTRIDLFAQQPLYAFSGLTATTAIGFVLTAYVWISAAPHVLTGASAPFAVGVLLSNFALAASTFAWPLWGVHRRLVAEKARWKVGLAARMQATMIEAQRRIDEGDRAEMAKFKDTLDVLAASEAALDKIRVWPWQPGTTRGLASAILLPILLWLITRLLEHVLVF